jgi:DNA-binding FrmR family transcriptional regulator
MSNRTQKAATLVAMIDLLNRFESKLALLDALDRDVTAEDCMDITDQIGTMTHSLHRLTQAVIRANRVNGVAAEYDNLFGEEAV